MQLCWWWCVVNFRGSWMSGTSWPLPVTKIVTSTFNAAHMFNKRKTTIYDNNYINIIRRHNLKIHWAMWSLLTALKHIIYYQVCRVKADICFILLSPITQSNMGISLESALCHPVCSPIFTGLHSLACSSLFTSLLLSAIWHTDSEAKSEMGTNGSLR